MLHLNLYYYEKYHSSLSYGCLTLGQFEVLSITSLTKCLYSLQIEQSEFSPIDNLTCELKVKLFPRSSIMF